MIQLIKITLLCLLTLFMVSCDKEIQDERGDEAVFFNIVPTIIEAETGEIALADTRAKVGGAFPNGAMIGLRITAPDSSPPISHVYGNFFGMFNGVSWFYYLDNINTGHHISGFSSWRTINVYGYYPYNAAVTNLAAIPFRIATLNGGVAEGTETSVANDYMVAGSKSKDMVSATPSGELPLKFGHIMTAIEFEMNRSISSVPYLTLIKVAYEITGGSPAREFTVSGTYKAINPDTINMGNNIAVVDAANSMVVTYPTAPSINSGSATRILLVMMPELRQIKIDKSDDATIKMTFHFKDQEGTPYKFEEFMGGNPSVTFKLSDITNGANDKGLLAGWSYTVKATLGYYTKFLAPTTGTPMPPHINYNELVDDPNNEFVDI